MRKNSLLNVANLTTLIRIVLLFVASYLLFQNLTAKIAAFFLIIIVIYLDSLDGVLARKLNLATEFGGVFDITGDRIVENVLWIVFAFLDLIPLWVPLIILTRGFITDAIRTYALAKGQTAFGKKTMIRSKLGRFIVASRFSRFIYGGMKLISFVLLAALLIIEDIPLTAPYSQYFYITANIFVIITVALCIIRAIPVVIDGLNLFSR